MQQCDSSLDFVEIKSFKLQFLIEGATRLLNDVRGRPNSTSDGGCQLGALAVLSEKSSDEGVSGSVGINDLLSWETFGRELHDHSVVDADDGISPLGDDDQAAL